MSDIEPTATGNLAITPLGGLLTSVVDRRFDGTLVLQTSDGARSAVQFVNGAPGKVKTAEAIEPLGRVLLEQAAIDDEVYASSLAEMAQRRMLHGELLLERGALDRKGLERGLKEQVLRKLIWCFALPPDTTWGFYEGHDFLQRWGGPPTRIEPLTAIWHGVRLHAREEHVERALARLGMRELVLHVDAQPARFKFSADEQALIDVLRARPQALSALVAARLADERLTRRFVYLLMLTRCFDLGVPGQLPVGVDEPPESSKRGLDVAPATSARARPRVATTRSPAVEARPAAGDVAAEIGALVHELDRRNHYELLGVPPDAPTSAIQLSFFALAKRYHPDKVGAAVPEVRDAATRISARLNDAYATLSSPEQRRAYDQTLGGGGGDAEAAQVERVLRAATAFQRAEILAKRQNFAGAAEEARRAMEDDPSQAEYGALFAWLEAQRAERSNGALFGELMTVLDRAVAQEPRSVKLRFWRAQILQRAGRNQEAVADFKRVLSLDPRHVDAQREVRLHEMRAGSKPDTGDAPNKDEKAGLLGKLFKR